MRGRRAAVRSATAADGLWLRVHFEFSAATIMTSQEEARRLAEFRPKPLGAVPVFRKRDKRPGQLIVVGRRK